MNSQERYNALIRIDNSDTWNTEDMDNLINWYEIDKDIDYKDLTPELVFLRIIYLHNRDCIKYNEPHYTISKHDMLSV